MLVHAQAFLHVALRQGPRRQVDTPGAGAQAGERGVVEAHAQRLTHVAHCSAT
jgi:hypothetical protein